MIKEFDIPLPLLIKMNDVARLIKSDHLLFENTNHGLNACGFRASMAGYASISSIEYSITNSLQSYQIPFPMGMQVSILSTLCKELSQANDPPKSIRVTAEFIEELNTLIPYDIIMDYVILRLKDTYPMQLRKMALLYELKRTVPELNVQLSGRKDFEDIMSLKANAGMQYINIGPYPISISHSVVNCNKGDIVTAIIHTNLNDSSHRIVEIIVDKPKKHCSIHTYMKILILR